MSNSLHRKTGEMNFENAKRMRKDPTHEEYVMWEEVRNRKLLNHKFRRQHPLNKYIADFYCYELAPVIELDGKYHEEEEAIEKEKKRTEDLKGLGVTVYRISNEEFRNRSLAIGNLRQFIMTLKTHSLLGEG
jgi:very-short-patch-repair endonuclease